MHSYKRFHVTFNFNSVSPSRLTNERGTRTNIFSISVFRCKFNRRTNSHIIIPENTHTVTTFIQKRASFFQLFSQITHAARLSRRIYKNAFTHVRGFRRKIIIPALISAENVLIWSNVNTELFFFQSSVSNCVLYILCGDNETRSERVWKYRCFGSVYELLTC